jgi:hypothetical protein
MVGNDDDEGMEVSLRDVNGGTKEKSLGTPVDKDGLSVTRRFAIERVTTGIEERLNLKNLYLKNLILKTCRRGG